MTARQPFYVVGPTGSGKSDLALALAECINGAVVNADAFQIYAGIPVLTAVPSKKDRERAPHYGYERLSLDGDYNAARFAEDTGKMLLEVGEKGLVPIITGGSGLYIKALTHGLSDAPPSEPRLRKSLETLTLNQQIDWLERLDPGGLSGLGLQNPRYVSRALEITLMLGVPASRVRQQWQRPPQSPVSGIYLEWDRETLYERINQRVLGMVDGGALEEVERLPENISATAAKAIGIESIRAHLRGEIDRATMVAHIQQATRRYAKRQRTWFQRETVFTRWPMSEDISMNEQAGRVVAAFQLCS